MSGVVPPTLKPIAHYVKIANEQAKRDPVIYYWCLFYAVQSGMAIDRQSPDALQFLTGLLGTLEQIKKQLAGNDAITNEVVAQAHIEDFAMKLFAYADGKEKTGAVDKGVVHAFYTAGHCLDIVSLFGEVDEYTAETKKYAKWKSTQIFSCLRSGTPYVSSQPKEESLDPLNPFETGSSSSSSFSLPPAQPPASDYGSSFGYDGSSSGNASAGGAGGAGGYGFNLPSVPSGGSAHENNYDFSAPSIPPSVPAQSYAPPPRPAQAPPPQAPPTYPSASGSKPTADEFAEARKLAKYAMSAIDYEDTPSVVDNLRKALALMEKYAQ